MAAPHFDPAEHGSRSDHYTGSLAFADGSRVGIARLRDGFALRVEPRIAIETVYMDRDEVRELTLRLIDATQHGEEE
jgi:hypothetical protein